MLPTPWYHWIRGTLSTGARPNADPPAEPSAPFTLRRSLLLIAVTLLLWLLVTLSLASLDAGVMERLVAPSANRVAAVTPASRSTVPVAVTTGLGLGGGCDDAPARPRRRGWGWPPIGLRQEPQTPYRLVCARSTQRALPQNG